MSAETDARSLPVGKIKGTKNDKRVGREKKKRNRKREMGFVDGKRWQGPFWDKKKTKIKTTDVPLLGSALCSSA